MILFLFNLAMKCRFLLGYKIFVFFFFVLPRNLMTGTRLWIPNTQWRWGSRYKFLFFLFSTTFLHIFEEWERPVRIEQTHNGLILCQVSWSNCYFKITFNRLRTNYSFLFLLRLLLSQQHYQTSHGTPTLFLVFNKLHFTPAVMCDE